MHVAWSCYAKIKMFCNALNVHISLFLFLMTGSQQSQEQANRRNGSGSDKHNESGVCASHVSVI